MCSGLENSFAACMTSWSQKYFKGITTPLWPSWHQVLSARPCLDPAHQMGNSLDFSYLKLPLILTRFRSPAKILEAPTSLSPRSQQAGPTLPQQWTGHSQRHDSSMTTCQPHPSPSGWILSSFPKGHYPQSSSSWDLSSFELGQWLLQQWLLGVLDSLVLPEMVIYCWVGWHPPSCSHKTRMAHLPLLSLPPLSGSCCGHATLNPKTLPPGDSPMNTVYTCSHALPWGSNDLHLVPRHHTTALGWLEMSLRLVVFSCSGRMYTKEVTGY